MSHSPTTGPLPAATTRSDEAAQLQGKREIACIYLFGSLEGMRAMDAKPADPTDPREFAYLQACRLIARLAAHLAGARSYEQAKARILLEDLDYYAPGTRDDTWAAIDAAFT